MGGPAHKGGSDKNLENSLLLAYGSNRKRSDYTHT